MEDISEKIWKRFKIYENDNLPFRGNAGTRNDLAKIMGESGFKTGAEIEVCEGLYSEILCSSIPDLKLLCVDPWCAYDNISANFAKKRYDDAIERLGKYNVEFIKKTSMEAVKDVPNESLDFVYIDGNHDFNYVVMDIIEWGKRIKKGGIIAGHDYYHFFRAGVVTAVDAYTRAHNIYPWYLTREREPSWFWIKQ